MSGVEPRLTKPGSERQQTLHPFVSSPLEHLGRLSFLSTLNDATGRVGIRLAPRAGRYRSSNLGSRPPSVRIFRLAVVRQCAYHSPFSVEASGEVHNAVQAIIESRLGYVRDFQLDSPLFPMIVVVITPSLHAFNWR